MQAAPVGHATGYAKQGTSSVVPWTFEKQGSSLEPFGGHLSSNVDKISKNKLLVEARTARRGDETFIQENILFFHSLATNFTTQMLLSISKHLTCGLDRHHLGLEKCVY